MSEPPWPRLPNAQLSHVGIHIRDLEAMTAFYGRLLGMVVTDSGEANGRRYAFMSRNPREHHQLVLATGRTGEPDMLVVNQLSFRLDSLEDLQRYYAILEKEGVKGLNARHHGNAWSLYFLDPEGNRIELYVPTEWYVSQPWRAPIDISRTAAELVAETAALMRDNPTSRPVGDWAAEMKARLKS